jgi:hypothetical protein
MGDGNAFAGAAILVLESTYEERLSSKFHKLLNFGHTVNDLNFFTRRINKKSPSLHPISITQVIMSTGKGALRKEVDNWIRSKPDDAKLFTLIGNTQSSYSLIALIQLYSSYDLFL